MKLLTILLGLLSICITLNAQLLKGKIFGYNDSKTEKEILPGANVLWVGTNIGAIANENGVFAISSDNITDKRLIVSFLGFMQDTIVINEETYVSITLAPDKKTMNEVVIKGDSPGAYISPLKPIKTEVITQKELTKAACCDLAGCFDTQVTVQPQTTNVVTNSKELRILGLSGVYNQLLFDGMPMIQGILATYIVSSYPGTLIDNIFVTKGANSVLQGFESISGQINIEPKVPEKSEKLLLNAYINSFSEKQANINITSELGKSEKWKQFTAFHTTQPANKVDKDKDNFIDLPLIKRYMIYNHIYYGNSRYNGLYASLGTRFLKENRVGGQYSFDVEKEKGSNSVYGQSINYYQPEVFIKSGYRFNDDHAITFSTASFYQNQDSYFGTVKYLADQLNIYTNIQHEWLWKEKHMLKYGFSYRYQDLSEKISFTDSATYRNYAGNYLEKQSIPGGFIENAFHWKNDKVIFLVGARVDHHQEFGYFFTPRSLLKLGISDNHTFRVSVGTGWRQVNLFSENINLLVSSRDIVFQEKIKPETGFNWGLNYIYRFKLPDLEGSMSWDYYQTRFFNQFFPDYDTDPNMAYIRNFTGKSMSKAFQIESNLKFFKMIELKMAYNLLDVYRMENNEKAELPFNSKNRVMAAVSYKTKNNIWFFDLNLHWYDKQRLPNTALNPEEYRYPEYSEKYSLVNCQITRKIKQIEIYTGIENVFDFRQLKPIISWQDPFSRYFDTSFAWGPTRGREFYLGVRWKMDWHSDKHDKI